MEDTESRFGVRHFSVGLHVVAGVGASHRVADLPVLLFEVVVESSGASVEVSNGTVVDGGPNYFVLARAL
jgi:hypothetical protein